MRPAFILPAILILSFSLRVAGLGFGLPHTYHQDEPIIVNHAMAIGVEGWNTKTYLPPQFASYFLFLFYGLYFIAGHGLGLFANKTDFAIQFLSDPTPFYLIGRFVLGVIFGTANIVILYRLGEKFFSRQTAVFASIFLSVSMLHVAHSHYVYMDIAVTFAVTLLFLRIYQWMKMPTFWNILSVGAVFGWAVSVKYTAIYFFPVMILAFFLAPQKKNQFWHASAQFLGACVLSLTVYAVISPFSFLDWSNFISQVREQSAARGQQGLWHHLSYSLLNGTGWLFLSLSLMGVVACWKNESRKASVLILGVVGYYVVNVGFSQPFSRYMMPVLPLLCLLASEGIGSLARAMRKPALAMILGLLVTIELLIPTLFFDRLLNTIDTRTECSRWIESKIPERSVIVLDNIFFGPRLSQTREQIIEKYNYLDADQRGGAQKKRLDLVLENLNSKKTYTVYYCLSREQKAEKAFLFGRPLVRPDKEELKRIGAEYVVLNYADPAVDLHFWKEAMKSRLFLVASFSPYKDPQVRDLGEFEDLTGPPDSRRDLFGRKTQGPYLEVYRIRNW